ncbi:hypothetical protein FACS189459_0090 [Bacilli bacterium]|nr:hypothetical protein FACS189459_0090 [Bacilli bacterium]
MIIILIIPNLTFDGMFKRINEKTPIEHYTVYTTMYHSITDMGGIIFLIFCPYRIRKIKNLGMALVPILP